MSNAYDLAKQIDSIMNEIRHEFSKSENKRIPLSGFLENKLQIIHQRCQHEMSKYNASGFLKIEAGQGNIPCEWLFPENIKKEG